MEDYQHGQQVINVATHRAHEIPEWEILLEGELKNTYDDMPLHVCMYELMNKERQKNMEFKKELINTKW